MRLILACHSETDFRVRQLIEAHADPSVSTRRGVTALMAAADTTGSRMSVVRQLLRSVDAPRRREYVCTTLPPLSPPPSTLVAP
jgi:ankyrin repeat protein